MKKLKQSLLLCLLSTLLLGVVQPTPVFSEEPVKEETSFLKAFNDVAFGVLFFDVSGGAFSIEEVDKNGQTVLDEEGQVKIKEVGVPFLVLSLVLGSIFFTFWYRWINIRLFKHAIDVVRGKFDRPEDKGEISHFRALTSALSATVGLGNIAGVAIAIQVGGPGAIFWMILVAVFGMTAKFSSCTLAQMYRQVSPDGEVSGGPMYYLDIALKQMGPNWGILGKTLAVIYAIMIIGASLGGGNMFQVNQTAEAFVDIYHLGVDTQGAVDAESVANAKSAIGLLMAIAVGAVILGGIKRIGLATSRIVPFMCGIYVLASMTLIFMNFEKIPSCLSIIFTQAFTENALFGGLVGVLVQGIRRAAFSNEAGLGSAAIVHAAAKTDEPVREGLVAMLGPFIDTIVICLMTGLVITISGVYDNPEMLATAKEKAEGLQGVSLTADAFVTKMPWFPKVLAICVALFAYSTMISWYYYGEKGWSYLVNHIHLGEKSVIIFRLFFIYCIYYGATENLKDVLNFSDVMLLSLGFPNIIGSVILAPKVWAKTKDYWDRYKAGEIKPVAP